MAFSVSDPASCDEAVSPTIAGVEVLSGISVGSSVGNVSGAGVFSEGLVIAEESAVDVRLPTSGGFISGKSDVEVAGFVESVVVPSVLPTAVFWGTVSVGVVLLVDGASTTAVLVAFVSVVLASVSGPNRVSRSMLASVAAVFAF